MDYRVDFDGLEWIDVFPGVRHKIHLEGGRTLRLVEYAADMPPHWCERGHAGVILEGCFEIEFDDGTRVFEAGDGVFIPDGAEHRHRARVLGDTVVVAVFVEDG